MSALLFCSFVFQFFKAVMVGLVASPIECDAVNKEFIVEGIRQDDPLPMDRTDFEHEHIGNNRLNQIGGILTSSGFVDESSSTGR